MMDIYELYYLVDKFGECGLQGDVVDAVLKIIEKQIPTPPVYKVHPEYKVLGKNYYCKCGALFTFWDKKGGQTRYCGNCGQKIKGGAE